MRRGSPRGFRKKVNIQTLPELSRFNADDIVLGRIVVRGPSEYFHPDQLLTNLVASICEAFLANVKEKFTKSLSSLEIRALRDAKD
jgi:hypothetical protein